VKDITYGPSSILHQRLRAAEERTLRVSVANDGGFIRASAPAGARILILPDSAGSEAALSGAMTQGEASPAGVYTSPVLAPGKYHVLATFDPIDPTPECTGRIWRARTTAEETEVGPNAIAKVTITGAVALQAGR
jgi:hypothetical protein